LHLLVELIDEFLRAWDIETILPGQILPKKKIELIALALALSKEDCQGTDKAIPLPSMLRIAAQLHIFWTFTVAFISTLLAMKALWHNVRSRIWR
jgi:hypothetical protein